MKPSKIKALLAENEITQTQIANKVGVKPQSVNKVIYGQRTSRRISRAIAASLGMNPEQLWPKEAA